MEPQTLTLTVIIVMLACAVFARTSLLVTLCGAWGVLFLSGVLSAEDALSGLASKGVATIAVLFVVATGLRETGGLNLVAEKVLGQPRGLFDAQVRIMAPVAAISAFMNNTPLVAMLMPVVSDWAKKLRLSESKLMMPLSYASIVGGSCTLIGTSTNLLVSDHLEKMAKLGVEGATPLKLFDPGYVGLPVTVVAVVYMLTIGRWLLPRREPPIRSDEDPREYTVEMMLEESSPLSGRTIEQAGLRHLPGLFLVEIDRQGQIMAAVSSNVRLMSQDRLVFVGAVESVIDLQKIRGLVPATNQVYKIDEPRGNRILVEAVVSDTCPLVGQTIREGRFRTRYNAAVIALGRSGRRIKGKLGDIVLQPGDTLLLEARTSFAEQQRNSRDFYLVSRVDGVKPMTYERAPLALAIVAFMIMAVTLLHVDMLHAALVAAWLMVLTKCCRGAEARNAIDLQVLLTIAIAMAIGRAIEVSGLAETIASRMMEHIGTNPRWGLTATFVITALLAATITAKAAVVLVLPIASQIAFTMHVSVMPFAMAVLIAASTTVATPLGYPTNLMVMTPGGYQFFDFMRVGVPLTLIIAAVSMWLIPIVWQF